MYPELFRIGNFPITTYGIFLAVGMLLALFVASRLAARDGLPRERIYDLGCGRWSAARRVKDADVLRRGQRPGLFARFSAFGRRFLRRADRRISGGRHSGPVLQAAVLEGRRRFCSGRRARPGVWPARLFFGRLLLGKADAICRGACILPKRATNTPAFRSYGPDGHDLYLHPTQLYESFMMLAVFAFSLLPAPPEEI